MLYYWQVEKIDKGKPGKSQGRKAMGLKRIGYDSQAADGLFRLMR